MGRCARGFVRRPRTRAQPQAASVRPNRTLVQHALGVLGRAAGIDGKLRARQFPAEANDFRRARLEAAGLPPRALRQIRALLGSEPS